MFPFQHNVKCDQTILGEYILITKKRDTYITLLYHSPFVIRWSALCCKAVNRFFNNEIKPVIQIKRLTKLSICWESFFKSIFSLKYSFLECVCND